MTRFGRQRQRGVPCISLREHDPRLAIDSRDPPFEIQPARRAEKIQMADARADAEPLPCGVTERQVPLPRAALFDGDGRRHLRRTRIASLSARISTDLKSPSAPIAADCARWRSAKQIAGSVGEPPADDGSSTRRLPAITMEPKNPSAPGSARTIRRVRF